MNQNSLTSILVGFVTLSGLVTTASAQQEPPARSIVNIAPDLYRAQNNNHYTVLLVTSEGIIMSDPINRDFSTLRQARASKKSSNHSTGRNTRPGSGTERSRRFTSLRSMLRCEDPISEP